MDGCAQEMRCRMSGFHMRQMQAVPHIHIEPILASALTKSHIY